MSKFNFPEGFDLVQELQKLSTDMVEYRHLPDSQRMQIMSDKMADIMKRGGHPKYAERVPAEKERSK